MSFLLKPSLEMLLNITLTLYPYYYMNFRVTTINHKYAAISSPKAIRICIFILYIIYSIGLFFSCLATLIFIVIFYSFYHFIILYVIIYQCLCFLTLFSILYWLIQFFLLS